MSAGNLAVDSNITGLAFAEETLGSPKTLPGTPVWYALEPNSYGEFGGQTKNVKRETINASRQKRKGQVVALEVAAGLDLDWTSDSPYNFMQGFMFADWRAKDNLPATTTTLTTTYNVASGGAAFLAGDLLYGQGFTAAANNGLHLVASSTGTTVVSSGLVNETAPAGAKITRIGRQGASGDYTITAPGGVPQLNTTGGNFSTLGIIPGEWVWIGGDVAATQFATAACNGFYRVASVANLAIVFDRWPGANPGSGTYTAATDAGAGKTIQLYVGHCIKNEATSALQKFRTYQFERFLGGTKYQYELGCGANTLKLQVKEQDKVTASLGFIGMDEDLTQVAAKSGTRVAIPVESAFNASTSFSRLRMIGADGVTPLTSILTDYSISIDNGIEALYGITTSIGAVDLKSGDFMVSGSIEAYLSSLAAVAAVKANPDCSIDCAMIDLNGAVAQGWLFDIPLMMLGDGRLKVEKDKPVKLPVNIDAAGHATLNHTLLVMRFVFLPQLAL